MDLVKNSGFKKDIEDDTENIPHTPEEDFVSRIYHSVDETAARELLLLQSKNGITPTCKRGCFECCSQFILINRSEAHALGQFIRRRFSADEKDHLKFRTRQWHLWNDNRSERFPLSGSRPEVFPGSRPFCPLLIDGSCSAYSMRPVTCRTHFVCSSPLFCRFSNNHNIAESEPLALTSVVTATDMFSIRLKERKNKNVFDYSLETMLLPHWLAIEMGWDFAITV
jgi:Fe-S-cluster containining protein